MVTLDIRWTVLCDLFLVLIADSVYDARSRAFLERVAEALGFEWLDVVRFENRVTDALEIQEGVEKLDQEDVIEGRRKGARKRRYAMMGLAAVGGGLVIGLSAGLLAPAIGAGLGAAFATVGITGTTGFLAGAGGAAVITTGGVLTGANIASRGMARRTREVRTFELKPLHNNKRVSCYITVGGKVDDVRLPFSVMDPIVGDVYSVHWEPDMMAEMGSALKILTSEIVTQVGQQVLQATIMYGLLTALQWPIILTKLGYLIDNPWSNALDRSRAAGLVLADTLIHRHAGVRPVSLIGFSLGARTIFYALQELARVKAYGLVQDVILFGATVTASKSTWLDVRSAVAGRFVNAYATNDWMLGYLFRATSGGLNTVAGLRPVETVPGLENVEVTEIITGHMSYRSCMPQLLAKVGFPIMADYFDEPEDPDTDMSVQERTIVNEAEEEAKRNRKKVLGIFPRKSSSRTGSGANTPTPRASTDAARQGSTPPDAEGTTSSLHGRRRRMEAAVRAISKTAGFDFQAISKELGKNIDVDHLPQPAERPGEGLPLPRPDQRAPIERSGSAPPVTVVTPPDEEVQWIPSPAPVRRTSYADPATRQEEEDDQGDITASMGGMSLSDLPSWDRPESVTSAKVSPPAESSSWRSPAFSLNAWSASTPSNSNSSRGNTPSAFSVPRAAPPARPHPPELTANPFAFGGSNGGDGSGGALGGATTNGSGSGSGSGKGVGGGGFFGGWGKKAEEEEQWATKNPW
ncbi:hypothetical protein EHS25_004371 [Saitozyma podzolica]|uniref:DUF726-domain-containing protein n=1 Tax=Saitozyma podzolica TaxID=1890683 RepID=A0A427YTZ7_9TREE|nr:hypothetical protein EHS25_004371 [Saitozyma podzolica]